jgi:hypothetical protein
MFLCINSTLFSCDLFIFHIKEGTKKLRNVFVNGLSFGECMFFSYLGIYLSGTNKLKFKEDYLKIN